MCRKARHAVRAEANQELALPVRLSEEEMDQIDSLIADGVFDSREEAVGYFLRAGIGAARRVLDLAAENESKEEPVRRPELVNLISSDP